MGKYRERTITSSEWVTLGRAKVIFNVDKPTRVIFQEEQVTQTVDNVEIRNRREFEIELTDPSTKVILVNPNDNLPTGGDMSYRQLERMLYSMYYAKAQELDVAQPPQG